MHVPVFVDIHLSLHRKTEIYKAGHHGDLTLQLPSLTHSDSHFTSTYPFMKHIIHYDYKVKETSGGNLFVGTLAFGFCLFIFS